MIPPAEKEKKSVKLLFQALVISAAINVGLIATFFYMLFSDRPSYGGTVLPAKEVVLQNKSGLTDVLDQFTHLSFDQLLSKLQSKQLIEEGYTQRDLSLACLVKRFHFNLEKALGTQELQRRVLRLQKGEVSKEIVVFPALNDDHFSDILCFASTERWPLTAKGLFLQIKRAGSEAEKSLIDAFCLTSEFLQAETLLNSGGHPLSRSDLIALLQEGPWTLLEQFMATQTLAPEFSEGRRQQFLLNYLQVGSEMAAKSLIENDGLFMAKYASDALCLALLQTIKEYSNSAAQFACALITSPRSDAIWEKAASILYQFKGQKLPLPYNHAQTLMTLGLLKESSSIAKEELTEPVKVQNKTQVQPFKPVRATVERIYIVQANDSLSKVAQKYKVSVETLRSYNELTSDRIVSGQILKIPKVM